MSGDNGKAVVLNDYMNGACIKSGKDASSIGIRQIEEAALSEVINGEKEARLSTDGLVRLLEDDILNSILKPGDRLDEQSLARRFEVSRTPVREALRHLASSGLIEIRKNQGATVKRLTTAELIEMFQVMAEYEGLSARLSARWRIRRTTTGSIPPTICSTRRSSGVHAMNSCRRKAGSCATASMLIAVI